MYFSLPKLWVVFDHTIFISSIAYLLKFLQNSILDGLMLHFLMVIAVHLININIDIQGVLIMLVEGYPFIVAPEMTFVFKVRWRGNW